MENLQYIEITRLHPHPGNPRKDLGDLTELADSIRAQGVLQNLTVVPLVDLDDPDASVGNEQYTVIIGHRRLAAAALAGLDKVPCVVADMNEKQQARTMLMENMQRADLTPYEQAQGFQMMLDLGDTVEEIAQQSGFSTTTVRRRLKMMELDQGTLKEVSGRQLSITDFDRLAVVEDIEERNKCLEKIGTAEFDKDVSWALRKQDEKKNRPLVEQFLKDINAKEISNNDSWGSKYQQIGVANYFNEWDPDKVVLPEDKSKQIYFTMQGPYFRLYIEREKTPRAKKSEKEKARDRVIREARKELKNLAIKTYTARAAFVERLTVNKDNEPKILAGAMAALALMSANYTDGKEKLWEYAGIKKRDYSTEETAAFIEAVAGADKKKLPGMVYAAMGDSEEVCNFPDYTGSYPFYRPSNQLRAIYAWLTSLGYEMSDEEKALQDGTYPAYKDPDKKEAQ